MGKEESKLVFSQSNFRSVVLLSAFYTFLALFFYIFARDPFAHFVVGSSNLIGVLINIFSAKNIYIHSDKVIVKKKIKKRVIEYRKEEVFFSNLYNGMYSIKNSFGFSIKIKMDESDIGLVLFKSKNEQDEFYKKIRNLGYVYRIN